MRRTPGLAPQPGDIWYSSTGPDPRRERISANSGRIFASARAPIYETAVEDAIELEKELDTQLEKELEDKELEGKEK